MRPLLEISRILVVLIIFLSDECIADVPKPQYPDSPTPGGEGGGGDFVPYIPHVDWFLTLPDVADARIVNRRIHFTFRSSGPVMRYNIIWSRPGKTETDMRWVKPGVPPGSEEYIINEAPLWDTEYSFKVQAESSKEQKQVQGFIFRYQITSFAEKKFHTPLNPAIKSTAKEHNATALTPEPKAKAKSPFDKVDNEVQLVPHPK